MNKIFYMKFVLEKKGKNVGVMEAAQDKDIIICFLRGYEDDEDAMKTAQDKDNEYKKRRNSAINRHFK